jgi:hypothetical protein
MHPKLPATQLPGLQKRKIALCRFGERCAVEARVAAKFKTFFEKLHNQLTG